MSSNIPLVIAEDNLSLAWAQTYRKVEKQPEKELLALTVSFTGFGNGKIEEAASIRAALDACLAEKNFQEIETVANTIFPQPLWALAKGEREKLFEMYLENLPAYVSMAARKNNRGLYFARLTGWNIDPKTGCEAFRVNKHLKGVNGNQLEFIIQQCKKGVRRSEFQAAIFDPARDHSTAAQLGFPCMQHITMIPDFKHNTITLNAFYATQQLFDKAYGNFLGLARLGTFMAHEIGLELDRVNIHIGIEKIDKRPESGKTLDELKTAIDNALNSVDTECVQDASLLHV